MKYRHNKSLRAISSDLIHHKLSILGITLTFGKWLEAGEILIRKNDDTLPSHHYPTSYTKSYNSYNSRNKLCDWRNLKKPNSLKRCAIHQHHMPLSATHSIIPLSKRGK